MDLVNYALTTVKNSIPRPILNEAYLGRKEWREYNISLDEQIRRKTIYGRVFMDMEVFGGDEIIIKLDGLEMVKLDDFNYRVEIPPERLGFRRIISALSVGYLNYNLSSMVPIVGAGAYGGGGDLDSAMQKGANAASNIPNVSSALVYAVDHRTIIIRNHLTEVTPATAKLVVSNAENLENISIRNAPDFAELVMHAVKSYIWVNMSVMLDQHYLEYGQELTSIKSYVDRCEDAETNYQTFLREVWGKIAFLNSQYTTENLMMLMLNPSL